MTTSDSYKTASRYVTERLIDEIKDQGKIEFVVTAGAETEDGETLALTSFKLEGMNNKYVTGGCYFWVASLNMLLTAFRDNRARIVRLADIGREVAREIGSIIQAVRVADDRRFWCIVFSSVRTDEGESAVDMKFVYSDHKVAAQVDELAWAVEATFQAFICADKDAFRQLRQILMGEDELPWLH